MASSRDHDSHQTDFPHYVDALPASSRPPQPSALNDNIPLQSSISQELEITFSDGLSLPTASDITATNPLMYRLSRSLSSALHYMYGTPLTSSKSHHHLVNSSPNISDFLPPVGIMSPSAAQTPRGFKASSSGTSCWGGSGTTRGVRPCRVTTVLWLLALLIVSGLLIARVTVHHQEHHQSIRGKHRDANGWFVLDYFLPGSHSMGTSGRRWDDEETNTLFEPKTWQRLTSGKGDSETEGESETKGELGTSKGGSGMGERESVEGEKGGEHSGGSEHGHTTDTFAKMHSHGQQHHQEGKKGDEEAELWQDRPVIREAQEVVNKDGEIVSIGTRTEKEEYSLLPNALEVARLQLDVEKGLMQVLNALKKIKELSLTKQVHGGTGVAEDRGYVAVCTIAKDQNDDVCEWLRYHHYVLGIQTFYIYDHESKVPLMRNITGCIPLEHVVYSYINTPNIRGGPLETPQMYAYNQCIMRSKGMHQWMAFIDMDEFITVTQPVKLAHFLEPYEKYGALGLNWRMFGSSGHVTRPKGSVLASYSDCLPNTNNQNTHTKTIVNMHHVVGMNQPHYPTLKNGYFTVDTHGRKTHTAYVQRPTYDRAFISHYVLKSAQEYGQKMQRGSAMNRHKSWSYFNSTNAQTTRQCPWGRALSKCAQHLSTIANASTNCFCHVSYITYRTCVAPEEVVSGTCIINGTSQTFTEPLHSIPVPPCKLPPVPQHESDEELDLDAEEEAIRHAAEKSQEARYEDAEEEDVDHSSERHSTASGGEASRGHVVQSKVQGESDSDGGNQAQESDSNETVRKQDSGGESADSKQEGESAAARQEGERGGVSRQQEARESARVKREGERGGVEQQQEEGSRDGGDEGSADNFDEHVADIHETVMQMHAKSRQALGAQGLSEEHEPQLVSVRNKLAKFLKHMWN